MIISISGKPGSGKSTLAKLLVAKLGWKHYSMGDLRRQIAREHGMTLEELNAVGERESWTDEEADERLRQLARSNENMVIDSRTAFHFIPDSLKIFFDVSETAGAQRIFGDLKKHPDARNEGRNLTSFEDVVASNRGRISSDSMRYKQYYQIDYLDHANYDFVLDTTDLNIQLAFDALWAFVKEHLPPDTSAGR